MNILHNRQQSNVNFDTTHNTMYSQNSDLVNRTRIDSFNSNPNMPNFQRSNFDQISYQGPNISANLNTSNNDDSQSDIRHQFLRRLKSIPKFDGNSYKELIEFIDICDTLYASCWNQSEENEFYEQMLL